jgi:diaminohydroxyphosphoribosylaminopyrimidine deaminase/5-amino-6-(5-phosphoribosylamino)uracil reductase
MDWLGAEELNEVLVEAGSTLTGGLLEAGVVDELIIYMAAHLMGDAARPLFHLPAITGMADRIPLEITDLRVIGPDLRLTARPMAFGR